MFDQVVILLERSDRNLNHKKIRGFSFGISKNYSKTRIIDSSGFLSQVQESGEPTKKGKTKSVPSARQ